MEQRCLENQEGVKNVVGAIWRVKEIVTIAVIIASAHAAFGMIASQFRSLV